MKFKFEDVKDAVVAIAGKALFDDGIVLSYKTNEEAIAALENKKLLSTDQKRNNLEKIGVNGFFCFEQENEDCMYCSADEFVRLFEQDGIIMALANRIVAHGRTFVKKQDMFSEEFIRSNLVVQLIENTPEFKASIEEAGLSEEYFGMKVITRLVVDNNEDAGILQTCVLPREVIESVIPGTTEEDILSMAEQNLKRIFKPIAKPLKENSLATSIYMIGCPLFGASLILFPELLKDITKDLGATFLSMISYNTDSWIAVTAANTFLTQLLSEEELIEASSSALQRMSVEMFANPKSDPVSNNVFIYKQKTNTVEIVNGNSSEDEE